MNNQLNGIEYLNTDPWETDEYATERFKRKMKKPVEIVKTKRVCGKLLKVIFREMSDEE